MIAQLFVTTLILFSSAAFAETPMGPGASGGGKVVVCRTSKGAIKSVDLLDLWEARTIFSRKLIPAKASIDEMVDDALKALSTAIRSEDYNWCVDNKCVVKQEAVLAALRIQAAQFFRKPGSSKTTEIKRLRGVKLNITPDSFEAAQPSGCAVEQAVLYTDYSYLGGTILVDQDLVDRLTPQAQAALIVHESLYKFLRQSEEQSSLRARRAVGLAFSGHKFDNLSDDKLPKSYYKCNSAAVAQDPITNVGPSEIFVFPVPNTANTTIIVFQATNVAGLYMLDGGISTWGDGNRDYESHDFSNLSELKSEQTLEARVEGSIQPELQPVLRIDEAGPGGVLKLSIAARPSPILPNGLNWQPLTCVYHAP